MFHKISSVGKIKVRQTNNFKGYISKHDFMASNRDLFEGVGCFPGKYSIQIDKNIKPVMNPPRRVPFKLENKLKQKLKELEIAGIIKKCTPQNWVSNLVVVEKPNRSLRICLDPNDLNQAIIRDYQLIPTVEDVARRIGKARIFTVLDLKDGYYHVKLDEESSMLCTFSTPFGCYRFTKLPFGLSNAPEMFQKINNNIFSDIDNVFIYFDDLLIFAESEVEHNKILEKVCKRARERGVKFNPNKLQFMVPSVKYFGHVFSKNGIEPDGDYINSIVEMKEPKNVKELQVILGMINYLRKFIPDLATLSQPLHSLLKKNIKWEWLPIHEKTLKIIKNKLLEITALKHFKKELPVSIQADASSFGLGCCLMQEGKPICFGSRILSESEKSFAQIEKEFLAIVFATRKFHHYIYGRQVEVFTDHKPLVTVMKKPISRIQSPRLQRMKIKLLKYNLSLKYIPGKNMHVADLLSRTTSIKDDADESFVNEMVHTVKVKPQITMTTKAIKKYQLETKQDPILSLVIKYCNEGWPKSENRVKPEIKLLFNIRNNIIENDGLLYFDSKLIIPLKLRKEVLQKLHEGHLGVVKSKGLARHCVYWPNISKDIQNYVLSCKTCTKFQNNNRHEPLIPHYIPEIPFLKVGIDILEFSKKYYLVIFDYYSKWLELKAINSKTANETINTLKEVFSSMGIPKYVVADNNPFNSKEYREFAKKWDIEFILTSPTYPQSNGMAERAVQTSKNMLKKCMEDGTDLKLSLLHYRNSPVLGSPWSPAQLLQSRKLRVNMPVTEESLRPNVICGFRDILKEKRKRMKSYYDRSTRSRKEFMPKENVYYRKGSIWEKGKIEAKLNNRSYSVTNELGNVIRRNSYHLRPSNKFKIETTQFNKQSECNHVPVTTRYGRKTFKPLYYPE